TYQISDVTITHSGVSPLVGLLLRNNKSTRYAAFFQPASNTRFNYNSSGCGTRLIILYWMTSIAVSEA
ncbi:MAG: hypothetical protein RIG77_17200, partial [Cyclobacteriaceae bacterium]